MSDHISTDSLEEVIYKDIPGYTGYRAGNDGTIWTCRVCTSKPGYNGRVVYLGSTWKKMSPQRIKKPNGRFLIKVKADDGKTYTRYVHRLVLETFVGPCPPGMEACHYPDRDTSNNTLKNLRWDTKEANMRDRKEHGGDLLGEENGKSTHTNQQILEIREKAKNKYYGYIKDLEKEYNITKSTIYQIIKRKTWPHI